MPAAEFVQPSIIGLFLAVPALREGSYHFGSIASVSPGIVRELASTNSTALYQVR